MRERRKHQFNVRKGKKGTKQIRNKLKKMGGGGTSRKY